ncbi:HNH/ENDO VII family nuclease [Streptomyces melanogenes]|uniref:HNH/ENDO VII family nuclease n=1 Tax=Streptomyces melanogenes TaxID=67326 RepID=A0ABZ1XBD3_9ACTN|nr:HNH/ENDO VII family nuclease [Streptomyces melanogenes]
MKQGLTPYTRNDDWIILHHMLQTQDGPIAEVTATMHSKNSHQLHWKPGTKIPSGIDRPESKLWKERCHLG